MRSVTNDPTSSGADRDSTRSAVALLFCLTLFRLFYGAFTALVPDEAYYWQWSRHLDWSYFDQGPGQALFVRFGTTLFGDTSLGVRFSGILLAGGTGYLAFCIARRWFTPRAALLTLICLAVAPLLFVGGIVATYDGPQIFFWTLGLYAVTCAVQENRPIFWYGVGVCVGLGALCKLTMWLFAPCVLLFLLVSPTLRRHLATPHPYLAFLLSLIVFSPVLFWSVRHGWTTILHAQALTGRGDTGKALRLLGDFLGGQALVVGPLLWLAELYALGKISATMMREKSDARRFLFAFAAPVFLVCLSIALKSRMEANWPAPLHVAGLMAVAVLFDAGWRRRGTRIYAMSGVALSALMTLIVLFPAALIAVGVRVSAELGQKANENYGWAELMRPVQAAREKLAREGKPVFLAGVNYRVPSLLAFYLPDRPETHELFFATRRDQYVFWTKPQTLIGQNAVLCLDADKPEAIALARRYFASVEEQSPVTIYRRGFTGPVKTWRLHLCRDFKGYDPTAHLEGY